MAATRKEYERLRGTGLPGFGVLTGNRGRIWLAKDHVLTTRAQWWVEEYRRFYFRDIQAIIIHKTEVGKVINLVFGALTLLPLLAAFATDNGTSVFWWIVTAAFGTILIINAISGPTCRCHIRTAVQTEDIAALRRIRRANKVLGRLRSEIVAAQGEIPAGEIPARMEQLARPTETAQFSTVPEIATNITEPTLAPPADIQPTG